MWPQIPADVAPWLYYLCVGAAVVITGVSKAGFGGGVGVVALPLMAMVMPPKQMLGVMLPLLIACDIFSNLHYLGQYEWRVLRPLLFGAVLGVVVGTLILWAIEGQGPQRLNQVLGAVIGSVCLLVIGTQLYRLTGRKVPTLPAHPASGAAVGAVAGTVSTLSHSAGPIVTLYMLQEKIEKRRMVGSLLIYFLLINTIKVPTLVQLDFINRQTLHDSIWFIPLVPVGTLAGAWMHRHISEKPFAVTLYIGAALGAGYMIYKAIAV